MIRHSRGDSGSLGGAPKYKMMNSRRVFNDTNIHSFLLTMKKKRYSQYAIATVNTVTL